MTQNSQEFGFDGEVEHSTPVYGFAGAGFGGGGGGVRGGWD